MADFSIPLTVPDAKVSELIDALNWQWGETDNGDGTTTPKTCAEIKVELKARTEQVLKDVFLRYKEHIRSQQVVVDGELDIT